MFFSSLPSERDGWPKSPRAGGGSSVTRKIAWIAAALLLFGGAPAPASSVLDWLLPPHDVEVITVTDVTPAGALQRAASPENPIYYMAVNAGYQDFGGIIAGDKIPAPKDMIRTTVRVLAKQGFLPADDQHHPAVLIIFAWGSLYPYRIPSLNPNLPSPQLNRYAMMRFLGGDKLGLVSTRPDPWLDQTFETGLTIRSASAEAIATAATDDLYVAVLAGYEFPIANPKHPVMLWKTKISCPARGLAMADTLPTMLKIAGPYIGRETAKPVWANASDRFKAHVEIGPATVEEYIESGQLPVLDSKPEAKKKRDRDDKK